MTTTAKRIIPGSVLTGSASTYYTAPSKAVVKSLTITNTTAAAVTATVYVVPLAGTAGASNCAINARPIAANETYNCPELVNQVIETGGMIQAFGSGMTIMASGVEIV